MNSNSEADFGGRKFSDSFGDEDLLSLYDESDDKNSDNLETAAPIYTSLSKNEQHYARKEFLARGGAKEISKVFNTRLKQYVALAELKPGTPVELYEPFLQEARLTASLDHPNIISVYDIGVNEDGLPYFTMELKSGRTMREVLKEKNQLIAGLDIFMKICDAMAYAHSHEIIHLDLKPENVQVGDYGEVTICDWGLGKILNSPERDNQELLLNADLLNNITLMGEVKGTPGFMAPEQINKNEKKDQRSDIFALGAILYNIFTGHDIVEGDTEKKMAKTRDGNIISPQRRFPDLDIPESINAVIVKALALQPAERYQSVEQLKEDILNYQRGFSTMAENAALFKEMKLFYQRHKYLCLISFATFLLFVSGSLFFVAELQKKNFELKQQRDQALEAGRQEQLAKKRARELHYSGFFANDDVRRYMTEVVYDDPIRAVHQAIQISQAALEFDQSDKETNRQLAYACFVAQRFELALEHMKVDRSGLEHCFRAAEKYAPLKKGLEVLSADDFIELMRDLGNERLQLLCKMIAYDGVLRKSEVDKARIVYALLALHNKKWDHLKEGCFVFEPSSRSLELSGKDLRSLSASLPIRKLEKSINFLSTLKLRSLKISGIEIVDVKVAVDTQIVQLDISESSIRKSSFIKRFKALQELIVARNQLAVNELNKVRDFFPGILIEFSK